jgi:two-component system, LytTR family, sensor kinase
MKNYSLYDVMDQKKLVSHATFLAFSIIVGLFEYFKGKNPGLLLTATGTFLLVFFQLEVFIFIGRSLFATISFERSPGEITRIVFFRFIIFMGACLISAMVLFLLLRFVIALLTGDNLSTVIPDFINTKFRFWFRSVAFGLSTGALILIILLWQTSLRREQKLREEKLIFQNETLKSQVNPHFLFNSLNTLSSLVGTQPELAEEFIGRFASIYRYILENGSKDRVPLEAELSFISDYFFLHKIRDDGKIQMEIKIDNPANYEILPVSLQILVENAIKHNKATRESPLIISIYLERGYIVVRNNLQKMSVQMSSTRVGLRNLAERTNLTVHKALVVEETNSDFIVKIPLAI